MLFYLILAAVLSLGCTQRTFGDVRKCTTESFEGCKAKCQEIHPDFTEFEKVKKCFVDRRSEYESCLKEKGVYNEESTPCYPFNTTHHSHNTDALDIPGAAKCYKRCLKREHKKCRKGCTAESPLSSDRKEKLKDCKNEDQILDCLEAEN